MSWGQEVYVHSDVEDANDDGGETSVYAPEDGESCNGENAIKMSDIVLEPLWNMFQSFIDVSSVDICWLRSVHSNDS